MKTASFIIILMISVKLLFVDTQLYYADIHTCNDVVSVLLDHSLEDSTDSITTCEIVNITTQSSPELYIYPVFVAIPQVFSLPREKDPPPPRA